MQQNQLPKKNIREIQPNPFLVQKRLGKKLRVAAYCRVSTAQEEQELSFESQVAYYTSLIENNPEWELVEIFADHGISGTKDTTRPGFMKMIDACKKHKVDLILTKSMSRFARNTLDCLKYIRLLKSLDVTIEFEKEGLNTGELSSEIYLTWFSAFAQAESESLSQNVTMGKRRLYKEGHFTFQYKHFLGYRKGPDGQPQIDPEQAETVKRIFYGFLAGKTPQQLKLELEQEGIPSPTGNAEWSKATIQNMLRNEKYAGDVLLQKTYTADFLTKKIRKNQGEIAQYYITDNHPAIIPRNVFQEVQLELARRSSKRKVSQKKTKTQQGKYTSKFALSERLVCGECGAMYRRTMWVKRDGTKDSIKRIREFLENDGIRAEYIMGEVELDQRQVLINDFRDGKFDVLITNPHTLAESVSLHSVCHDAIYFKYSYNLVHLLQSKDRIHRLGLSEGQYTQYYFMENQYLGENGIRSIDHKVYARLKEKEQTMLDAIDNHELEPIYTSEEDLNLIFGE